MQRGLVLPTVERSTIDDFIATTARAAPCHEARSRSISRSIRALALRGTHRVRADDLLPVVLCIHALAASDD